MQSRTWNPMKRRAIYKHELVEICDRQVAAGTFIPDYETEQFIQRTFAKSTKPKLVMFLEQFGTCECSTECTKRLTDGIDFDHFNPNAFLEEGDPIDWRAMHRQCHADKTNGTEDREGDKTIIAKVVRKSRKHGVDRLTNPMPEKKGNRVIQNRGFPEKPDGYKYQWGKRSFGQ